MSKQGLSGAVVDLGKKAEHISFSAEELRDLFTFDPNTDCLTHDLLGCKCSGDGRIPGNTRKRTYWIISIYNYCLICGMIALWLCNDVPMCIRIRKHLRLLLLLSF